MIFAVGVLGACGPAGASREGTAAAESDPVRSRAVAEAAGTITEEDFAYRVGVIAHDSMGGRDTPSAGLEATASWIASEFERFGLRGGAEDGGFVQRYPLRSKTVDVASSYVSAGSVTLAYGVDVAPLGADADSFEGTAEVVVLSGSTGSVRALGDDLAGRHVVVLGNRASSGRATMQLAVAASSARPASVWVASRVDDATWDAGVKRAFGSSVSKGWGDPGLERSPSPPMLGVRARALDRLLDELGVDVGPLRAREAEAVRIDAAPGGQATLRHMVRSEALAAPNVVGVLDGGDPRLADEFVVFSAHMDHLGTGTADANGDSIFNGADDDASGTAAVMEIAEAMAALTTAPGRSTVFLLVSGEEGGLWGSEWYADHPSAPIEQFVADFNADMVGRNWGDTIVAIGREHSDLGVTLDRVVEAHPELGMMAVDDLWPGERFYFRSDHFNFARRGVPVLFFFNGTHDDYHGLDDEADRIDAEKGARVARLLYYLGLEVADAHERPSWNPESYAEVVTTGR